MLMGFTLIAYKYYDFHQNASAIREICSKVSSYYKNKVAHIHPEMKSKFRILFVVNGFFNYIWGILVAIQLFSALMLQAIISWGETLPMPARYPFLEILSPKVFFGVSLFQSAMYAYNLFLIVMFDSTVICIIFYMYIFLEFLHHKTKELDVPGIDDDRARKILKGIIAEHQTLIE